MPAARTVLASVVLLTVAGCGGSDEPKEPGLFDQARQAGSAVQGLQEMGERLEEQANVPPAEPVDFRRLKEMLPETAAGLSRTSAEGARQGMGGMNVSNADGTYGDGDGRITLSITDMGGMQAAMMLGAAWTMVSVDRETDTETERTREIAGHPGYEKFNTEQQAGELQALVADRFLVKAEGRGVSAAQIQAAFDSVDLSALEAMKDEGRPAQ